MNELEVIISVMGVLTVGSVLLLAAFLSVKHLLLIAGPNEVLVFSGRGGYKLLKGLFRSLGKRSSRRVGLSILAVQAVLWVVSGVLVGWWVYPVMWLLPWLTVWRSPDAHALVTPSSVARTAAVVLRACPSHTGAAHLSSTD